MPSKKKKYNARFPAGRIKKIMQTDEEVGKVAQAVPVIISRTLELFVESLLKKTVEITTAKNAKTLTPCHLKQCILSESRFDFLTDLVSNIPDAVEDDEISNSNPVTNRRRTSVETAQTHSSKPAPVFNLAGSHNNHVSQQSSSNSAGTSFNLQSVPTSGIPVQTIQYAPATSSTHNHPTSNHLLPAVSHAYSNQYRSGSVVDSQSSHVSSFGNNTSHTSQSQASVPPAPSGIPGDAHNHVKITVPANLLSAAPACVKITVPGNNHVLHSFPIDISTGSPYSVQELNGTVPRRDSSTNVFNGMVPSYTPAPVYSSSNLVIDEDYDN